MSNSPSTSSDAGATKVDYDVVIVGAGLAGLGMLQQLHGSGLTAHAFEAADNVGGTWYWNRYPGICCDSESQLYSLGFDQELLEEWEYQDRFPSGPEVLSYINHFADRYDLRKEITFATRVVSAEVDPENGIWTLKTSDGAAVTCRYFVSAVGNLSAPQTPDIPGIHGFKGKQYHTARWPHEGVDLTGLRVGVVGTGATGVQAVPKIAEQAAEVYVFQRTANYIVPARNRPLTDEEKENFKTNSKALREKIRSTPLGVDFRPLDKSALEDSPEERQALYQAEWDRGSFRFIAGTYNDLATNEEANETAAEFVRERIRELIDDPETAEALSPRDHPLGSKRPPLEQGYFEAFNKPHVKLVDLRATPIETVTATGVQTSAEEIELDVLVFATGFDALTGSISKIDIHTAEGERLADRWAAGPDTYLGLSVSGFPNMFLVTGPGSPSVLTNLPAAIEHHIEWIVEYLKYAQANGISKIDARRDAEEAWTKLIAGIADETLMTRADSWYMGANVPGKVRRFMAYAGGMEKYRQLCTEIASNGYEGFDLGTPEEVGGDPAAMSLSE